MTVLRRLPLLVLVSLVWAPSALAWSRPVDGPVLRPFTYDESHPYAAGQHRGIDIGADSAGESVVAPAAGTVSFAGSVPTSGNCVTIETADGYSVTLTHLGSVDVAKGATVAEGDAVGTIGPSGTPEVDGAYVHLGIRLSANPLGYVDPLGLLPPLSPPPPPPPADDSGSAGTSAPGAATPPPTPALTASTPPGPDDSAAPVNPTPASPVPEQTQAEPTVATGEAQRAAGRGKPVPAPHAPTASSEFAELPGSGDRTGDGEAANGDSADPGNADQASDPSGVPGGMAPPREHAPRGHASGTPAAPPAEPSETWVHAGRHLLRSPVSEPPAGRPQRVATTSPLSFALGAGPGLLALMIACAAFLGRARRRAAAAAVAGAAVIHLPRHRFRQRHERRAA